jgi:hypothetical protein
MPETERAASAMVAVSVVHAVVELAVRLPAAFRSAAIAEAHRMMVAHYSTHDAKYGARPR